MPCQNSSVMNGRNGWNSRSVCDEHEINHREGVRLARRRPCRIERRLARLEIPVAILAPEKTVERRRRVAEPVFVERGGHFADGRVEPEQNPFVVAGEQLAVDLALNSDCRPALHLAETAGVPELVAEIAAEFDVLFIEQNSWPSGAARITPKRKRIRAVLAR